MGEFLAIEPEKGSLRSSRINSHDGYVAIIRRQMTEKNIKARELQRLGIISERTRRAFDERLSSGQINIFDLMRIYDHLEIDPVRAMVAVMILHKPMAYFEPFCETLVSYTEELSISMHEQHAAASGDFQPIRRNLVKAHTSKLTRQLYEHQERLMKLDEQVFQ